MSLYEGKTILAPMVRVGNVGFRVFCASQGADVVFSEEIVANKLKCCRREVVLRDNSLGPMIEYVAYEPYKNQYKRAVVFSTHERSAARCTGEAGAPVVLQLGVSTPEVGAAAAVLCCEDVDGLDLNMGCPKKFSVENGMGAALMSDTERAASILVAVDDAVNAPERLQARGRRVPLSFKTRLLETAEATAHMLTMIMEKVGPNRIHAITLHARTVDQRSEKPPHYDRAAATVKELRRHPLFKDMCFVLNGSVTSRADGAVKMRQYGFDAVMIARHAMWDMTVFSPRAVSGGECGLSGSEEADTPLASTSWMGLYGDFVRCLWKYRTLFSIVKYHLARSACCIRAMKHLSITVQRNARGYEDVARILELPPEVQKSMRGNVDHELVASIPEEDGAPDCARPLALSGNGGGGGGAAKSLRGQSDDAAFPIAKKLKT